MPTRPPRFQGSLYECEPNVAVVIEGGEANSVALLAFHPDRGLMHAGFHNHLDSLCPKCATVSSR